MHAPGLDDAHAPLARERVVDLRVRRGPHVRQVREHDRLRVVRRARAKGRQLHVGRLVSTPYPGSTPATAVNGKAHPRVRRRAVPGGGGQCGGERAPPVHVQRLAPLEAVRDRRARVESGGYGHMRLLVAQIGRRCTHVTRRVIVYTVGGPRVAPRARRSRRSKLRLCSREREGGPRTLGEYEGSRCEYQVPVTASTLGKRVGRSCQGGPLFRMGLTRTMFRTLKTLYES